MLTLIKAFIQSNQFCSPRAGNPGNVLLTSRNRQEYFYQCCQIETCFHICLTLPEKIETIDYNRESTVHAILLLTGFL